MRRYLLLAACLLVLAGCNNKKPTAKPVASVDYSTVKTPLFSADSAAAFAEAQVGFGSRTPGSKAWEKCAAYIEQQMNRWCDTVIVQRFNTTLWDGQVVPGRNIIASLNVDAPTRILLAAHWDSRMWADHDANQNLRHQPVPGANDGASGSALLMEMARSMSLLPPSIGIDFLFFDVEDQGTPEWGDNPDENTWCLGSQYWASNRHLPSYTALYGILFDMVGTDNPRFTKEQVSRYYAPALVNKLWATAAALGKGGIFVDLNTDPILDDHLYVNRLASIPMIDIVQNSPTTSFFPHWHTTTDDLSHLNRETLSTVALVVLKTIYADYPSAQ